MQKPFANSVSQALLYRFTELGYKFLESPEGKSNMSYRDRYFVDYPNTIEAHYSFLTERHENEGLDFVLEQYCFSLLEKENMDYRQNDKNPNNSYLYSVELDSIVGGVNSGKIYFPFTLWELVDFCLEVENGA